MKKFAAVVLSLILCLGVLTACGADYKATESTVFISKNGKVVSTDVEEFDTASYDEAGLKSYIDDAISAYTKENGKDAVSLKKLDVADGKATLTVEYDSYSDFYNFVGVELFSGSIAEALASGYDFSEEFAAIVDGNPVASDTSAFLSEDGYKVVVIKGNVNVNVPGEILFVSTANTQLVDKNTIKISDGFNLLTGKAEAATEEVANTEATEVVTTEATEISDDMSVDEDEIIAEAEEDETVTFDFGNGSDTASSTSTYTNVYTYVIYK